MHVVFYSADKADVCSQTTLTTHRPALEYASLDDNYVWLGTSFNNTPHNLKQRV